MRLKIENVLPIKGRLKYLNERNRARKEKDYEM